MSKVRKPRTPKGHEKRRTADVRRSREKEFRQIHVAHDEVKYLLKLSKRTPDFPSGLLARLVDSDTEFRDEMLKLKELIKTAKSNAHWVELESASKEAIEKRRQERKEELRETYEEIAFTPAAELRKALDKERIKKNVLANKRRRKAVASKGRKRSTKRKRV
jgi:hypothetical protein